MLPYHIWCVIISYLYPLYWYKTFTGSPTGFLNCLYPFNCPILVFAYPHVMKYAATGEVCNIYSTHCFNVFVLLFEIESYENWFNC